MNRPNRQARAIAIAKANEDQSKIMLRTAALGLGACALIAALAILIG